MYEPSLPRLAVVRSRISSESWEARVAKAREGGTLLERVVARVKSGEKLNHVIREELPASRRSWAIRSLPGFEREGFESLIDERVPREPKVAKRKGNPITRL